ncbi:MAG: DUF924 family protein [Rhizobiaceae bacterium]|nr:DUF924 family protein [Rhizobiaceae bacterium]
MSADHDHAEVTAFWREAGPEQWFTKDEVFDAHFRETLRDQHFAAARRELDHWMEHPEGALALMILLDQYPRNCFRGTGHMYATDPLARSFARKALAAGHDMRVEEAIRAFFYLPFSHSENLADQEIAVEKARPMGTDYLEHAIGHRDIVARFGHFPHRNRLLGRETTPEEQAFLDAGGFAG